MKAPSLSSESVTGMDRSIVSSSFPHVAMLCRTYKEPREIGGTAIGRLIVM